MHRSRLGTVVIDCQTADLDRAAEFWAKALNRPASKPQDPADQNYRELHTPPGEIVVAVQQVGFEGAMEAFVLALGLRMIGSAVDHGDT